MKLFPNGRCCWYCCDLIGVRGNGGMKEHQEYCEDKGVYDLYCHIKFTLIALFDREKRNWGK
jgi:hypothetical protein